MILELVQKKKKNRDLDSKQEQVQCCWDMLSSLFCALQISSCHGEMTFTIPGLAYAAGELFGQIIVVCITRGMCNC